MVLVRHDPGRVDQLAKGGAVPEEEECYLRVWEVAKFFEKLGSFINSLLRVTVAELCCADGSPEQLEVAVTPQDHVPRKVVNDVCLRAGQRNELAFAGVELQADFSALVLEVP